MNFAVIKTGGKQYLVKPGSKLKIEKLSDVKDTVFFDNVLLRMEGSDLKIGAPNIEGARVEAKVKREGREAKKIVFKFSSKARYKKKKGHRQEFTEVEIVKT